MTATAPSTASTPAPAPAPAIDQRRNLAVDAYRGLVMLLMMGEVLSFAKVAQSFPNSHLLQFLAYTQSHVEWTGMSLHDTIQPSFTFSSASLCPTPCAAA